MLDRRHYRLLLAIDAHRQLGAAAEALSLSQPAASHQIREAERRLGITLFKRSGRSIELTRSAKRLVETAAQTEDLMARAEADAVWLDRGALPSLRIAVGAHDFMHWLPVAAQALAQSQDRLQIEVLRLRPDDLENAVKTRQVDVALLPGFDSTPGLTAGALFRDRLVGVFPPKEFKPGTRVAAGEFRARHYLTYQFRPQSGFEYERFFRPSDQVPERIFRLESVTAIIEMIAAGRGVSILPLWSIAPAVKECRVQTAELIPSPPEIDWALILRADAPAELMQAVKVIGNAVDQMRQA